MEKINEVLKKYSAVYLTTILMISMIGISFAVATYSRMSGENMINLGQISMTYEEPSNAYVLENALPISDDSGKGITKYFEFKVMTHATTNENDDKGLIIPYEVNLGELAIDSDKIKLTSSQVKVYLTKVVSGNEVEVLPPTLISNLIGSNLNNGTKVVVETADTHKNAGSSITTTYRLRAWVDIDVDASLFQNNIYQYKFNVNINSNVGPLEKETSLNSLIMSNGVVSEGAGLYVSTDTNSGNPTYYYRGAVENNYVSFAGFIWRVVRINEDGTVRLIIDNGINDRKRYEFNPTYTGIKRMYYSESNVEDGIMKTLGEWYDENLKAYDSKIIESTFCEEAKVKYYSDSVSGDAVMSSYGSYEPNFKCSENDGNDKGMITAKIGLISVDEALHAGGIVYNKGDDYYLTEGGSKGGFWTMSPAGFYNGARAWNVDSYGDLDGNYVDSTSCIRPVISIAMDSMVTGSGISDDPWKISKY